MPTTRSRSRAPKEPSVEELKEAIKGIYEELDGIYKQIVSVAEAHDSLSDWAERHSDFHNRVRDEHKRVRDELDELDKPPTFLTKVCLLCAFCFSPVTAVSAVLFGFLLGFLDAFKS